MLLAMIFIFCPIKDIQADPIHTFGSSIMVITHFESCDRCMWLTFFHCYVFGISKVGPFTIEKDNVILISYGGAFGQRLISV